LSVMLNKHIPLYAVYVYPYRHGFIILPHEENRDH
jgi:hypothetical protein